jgi:3-phytase
MKKTILMICLSVQLCLFMLAPVVSAEAETPLEPVAITGKVRYDSDDPAIWVNRADPSKSLVLGTDKHEDGALYVFDLAGRVIEEKCVRGLVRPNNVDVEYGLMLQGKPVDIAAVTERGRRMVRLYRLPDMTPLDNGGIRVFDGEALDEPMGIALYKRSRDGNIYLIVSRKEGPKKGYLWEYLLRDDGAGRVMATKVRAFGAWRGVKEIEAVAVDDGNATVYYSDERFGIRKYSADPAAVDAGKELAVFGQSGFAADREGIAVTRNAEGGTLVLVSDQSGGALRIYSSTKVDENRYRFITSVPYRATETDGLDLSTEIRTPEFPEGVLVAMSDDRTFQFYSLGEVLKRLGERVDGE